MLNWNDFFWFIACALVGAMFIIGAGCNPNPPEPPIPEPYFIHLIGVGQMGLLYDDYNNVINTIADSKGNYIRFFTIFVHIPNKPINPYKKISGYQVDINQWDSDYFARLTNVLKQGKKRGIIYSVNLIDHCGLEPRGENTWARHPWNAVNGGFVNSGNGLDSYLPNNRAGVERFVRQMLTALQPYEKNLIIELGNEIECSDDFIYWLRDLVRSYGFTKIANSGRGVGDIQYDCPHNVNNAGQLQNGKICSTDGCEYPNEGEMRNIVRRCYQLQYGHFEADGWDGRPDTKEYTPRVFREEIPPR